MAAGEQPSEFDRERLRARDQSELELLKATIAFEHAAIRPLYLLNGGAIIAVLTFLGHAVTSSTADSPVDGQKIKLALMAWAVGLLLALAATALGYISQFAFLKEVRRKRDGDIAKFRGNEHEAGRQEGLAICFGNAAQRRRNLAYAAGLLSVLCFLIGSALAIQALTV